VVADRSPASTALPTSSSSVPTTAPEAEPEQQPPPAPSTTSTPTTSAPATTAVPTTSAPRPATSAPPPATEPAAPTVTTGAATQDGVTLTLTATQPADDPSRVHLAIRVRTDHGSSPSGGVYWGDGHIDELGPWGVTGCIPEEGGPLGPDPTAGPLDETLEVEHRAGAPGPLTIDVSIATSFCTTDSRSARAGITVVIPG
jgi:hypothetical protein